MTFLVAGLGEAYRDAFVDTGKQPELFFLLTFLLTFGFIRLSTHMIRAQVSWWPGNVQVGGTHIHHLVWGILLVLIVGYVGIAIAPGEAWREVLAILFGIGAALTLDEFALWLNLKDVYWSAEGRRSIDAVIVAAVLAALVILGARIWIDLAAGVQDTVAAIVGTIGFLNLILVLVNFAKEKFGIGIIGLLFSPVALVGAFRLARPSSPWARLLYREKTMARARARFADEHRWLHRVRRGKPQSAAGSG
jgi:lysyl-tRNA synthetase class 2